MIQAAALEVLQPKRADQETNALRKVFARKRTTLTEGLKQLGIRCAQEPEGTFYTWASLDQLPKPFNDADTFFRKALEYRVVTVPGQFFDVNPGHQRTGKSPYRQWMRFSYGPPMDNVVVGFGTDGKDAKIRPCKGVDALPARCAEEKSDAGTEVHPLARPLQFYSGGSLCPFSSRCHRMPFFSTSSRLSPDPRYPCSIITRLSCGVPHR